MRMSKIFDNSENINKTRKGNKPTDSMIAGDDLGLGK